MSVSMKEELGSQGRGCVCVCAACSRYWFSIAMALLAFGPRVCAVKFMCFHPCASIHVKIIHAQASQGWSGNSSAELEWQQVETSSEGLPKEEHGRQAKCA